MHKQPWPYFFVLLIPTLWVVIAATLDALPRKGLVLAAALYFGAIGAFDDILKIRHRSNERGLARHWKYAAQIAFGGLVGILYLTAPSSPYDPSVARDRKSTRLNSSHRT